MPSTTEQTEMRDRVLDYVRTELAAGVTDDGITATTPLLEAGILDSLRTAKLISWLRTEVGVRVPPTAMTGQNFRDAETIAELVLSLRAAA
jgi:acyl carrier protein